ncbi:MFS transporter [Shouchella patagoniensis]|uniref:MFS transporter n=1 Tax=Shouchella patagoniensis TaxID=228576 RepID=UPI0009954679|nr:MFS transporter [Shouchella patagoniensis]
MKLSTVKGFGPFWVASTSTYFGTYITTFALQVLIVVNQNGTAIDVGWINASRWLPYVFIGLLAGVFIDRMNRKFILVTTDIGRGSLLILIFLLYSFDMISMIYLALIMIAFGALSIFNDAAYQSFIPQLVPRPLLTRANARLEQSAAVAETSGPALAGWITAFISAPFTLLINSVSYFISGVLMSFVKQPHKTPIPVSTGPIFQLLKEGVNWVYRHKYLRILALNTHVWFLFHSMTTTVFITYVLLELGLSSFVLGMTLAAAGIGAVAGSTYSPLVGIKVGVGKAISLARILYCPAVGLVVLAQPIHSMSEMGTISMLMAGQFLYGIAMGIEGPNEMGYRQSITPLQLQGRMNTTMRSINRSMIIIGAPLGGFIADAFGSRHVLMISATGLGLCAIWLMLSPMRNVKLEEDYDE